MIDPIRIDDSVIDRAEIAALLRQDGRLLVFLKSGKPISVPDTLSREEFEALARDL